MSRLAFAAVSASALFCIGACEPEGGKGRATGWPIMFGLLMLLALVAFVVGLVGGYFGFRALRHRRSA